MLSQKQKIGVGILDRIGNTPLLRLEKIAAHLPGIQLLGKAEWANPGGSVKDRAASAIVLDAIERGVLRAASCSRLGLDRHLSAEAVQPVTDGHPAPDSRLGLDCHPASDSRLDLDCHLLDATSGNTGIAYAMLAAALGFRVTLCMPSNVSAERKRILHAYGAEVLWTDPNDGSDGAIRKARELAADTSRYWYADQYGNHQNWLAHYRGTGVENREAGKVNPGTAMEIWQQTAGQVTHFVAGLGTSGTFMGITRRLKELNPQIECISMQPDSPFNGLEGLKHMPTAIVPPIYDPALADRNIEVETEAAYAMAKRFGREEGLLVGISAAAAVVASLQIAEECAAQGRPAVIVTVLCDAADKYLSERFWEE